MTSSKVPDFGYTGEVGPEGEEWAALSDNYTQFAHIIMHANEKTP